MSGFINNAAKTDHQVGLWRSNPLKGSDWSSVVSEVVTFENRKGMRIVGFHDFVSEHVANRRWMIVLPGYGETKTDVISISYFLAKNGFHTLRFDYSNHVGESDGDILYTTLTQMKDDILSSLDYIFCRFQPTAVGAVGSSLASRVLFRVATEDDRIGLLLNLVSVVDLRKTLFAIYNEDYIKHAYQGITNGIMDVLGFQVDADRFLQSAIQDHYENLTTTINDVGHIKIPMVFFAAENDLWVEVDDVRQVFHSTASKQKHISILKGSLHTLDENPRTAKVVLKEVVEYSSRYLPDHERIISFQLPSIKEVRSRIRKEKERNRFLHKVTKEGEREFWKSYLQKYSFIINVHDYWNLLDLIYRLLGGSSHGERVLDTGCGIGNYGTFLLVKFFYQLKQMDMIPPGPPCFSYVGVDFVEEAIVQAKETHGRMVAESSREIGLWSEPRPPRISYFLADLESSLPFEDNVFDKICCNLVVSYLENPKRAVEEMMRVLKPRGKMVVSSLKPFADLSEVYRNFVQVTEKRGEIIEARKLLSNAGLVKAKEAEGIYRFFSEKELLDLFGEADVREVETYRSFGNQANIVLCSKA